ncbi:MAG TPA: hypothetical protein VHT24_14820 [Pseudacidobacterium sp.]|jgi:hypothetical protein|nr:hypothetical protein [Pseudacidobacterium sp.]
MIPQLRHDFNQRFRPEAYRRMLHSLDACVRTHVGFRIAETPCFFPKILLEEMAAIGIEIIEQLVNDKEYLRASRAAIPPECRAADEAPHPHFVAADFGLARGADGKLTPRLIGMHASPVAIGFQFVLNELYRSAFELDAQLGYLLGGHTELSFWKLVERVVQRGHHPEHVVLGGIGLERQKFFPDVVVMAERLGVDIADLTELEPDIVPGRPPRLCYRKGHRRMPVYRIYNYTNPGELGCGQVDLPFDFRDSFAVEWAGHPNWSFHISPFSIPFLDHPAVLPAVFLDEWLAGKGREHLPEDRRKVALKRISPIGHHDSVHAPSDKMLREIPKAERKNYLLQQYVSFEEGIDTPRGKARPEIRILYLWPDGGHPEPVVPQIRIVDTQEWAGVSAGFYC